MIRLFSPQDFDQFRLWLPLKTYLFNSTSFENSENILNYFCGDRSINRPIKFRIDSGLLGPWPIRGCISVRGHHTPRQYASADDQDVVLLQPYLKIRSPQRIE